MKKILAIFAVTIAVACQTLDSPDPAGLKAVDASLGRGQAALGVFTLQTEASQYSDGQLLLEGVHLLNTDGSETTADAGTLTSHGENWTLVMPNSRMVAEDGGTIVTGELRITWIK